MDGFCYDTRGMMHITHLHMTPAPKVGISMEKHKIKDLHPHLHGRYWCHLLLLLLPALLVLLVVLHLLVQLLVRHLLVVSLDC